MKRSGMTFRESKSLLYRMSQEGDVYLDGTPVPEHHCVVVHYSDCELVDGTTNTYKTDGAVCLKDMTGHSATGKFYGKFKLVKNDRGAIARDLETGFQSRYNTEYYQAKVYLVDGGRVYVSSLKYLPTPKVETIFQIEQKEIKEQRSLSFPERLDIKISTGELTYVEANKMLVEHTERQSKKSA